MTAKGYEGHIRRNKLALSLCQPHSGTSSSSFITSSLFNVLSEYSLFIRRYSRLATFIILSKSNWSLLPLCFTLSLESARFVSLSTSFWYQFLHSWLTYSFIHHFFLFLFTTLLIHNSLSLKTYLFHKSYPHSFTSSSRTASTDYCLDRFFWATRFCQVWWS